MREYRVSDARDPLDKPVEVAYVDLPWSRPNRCSNYITYETYSPGEGLWNMVNAVYESLVPGGWAFFDCDDWLLARLIVYLQDNWGDVCSTYKGGGYRRTGTVVYDGNPGGGHYFTNAGYHVVMAHKGETDRSSSVPAKQVSPRPDISIRNRIKWGTIKPVDPYQSWIPSVMQPDETLYIPFAGTAPAAIALENTWEEPNYICVDSEKQAKIQFKKRMRLERSDTVQTLGDYNE